MEWLMGLLIILVLICCIISIINNRRTGRLLRLQEIQKQEILVAVKDLVDLERKEVVEIINNFKDYQQEFKGAIEEYLSKHHETMLKDLDKVIGSMNHMIDDYNNKLSIMQNITEQRLSGILDENRKHHRELFESMLSEHVSAHTKMMEKHSELIQEVANQVTNEIELKVDKLSRDLRKRIDIYIEQEKIEINNWLKTVKACGNNHPLAIEVLESALNKFPSSRELISEYRSHIKVLMDTQNSGMRKQAIERYNRTARVYLDNCLQQDWNYAKEMMDNALKIGNEYINEIEQYRYKKANQTILQLEMKTSLLKNNVELSEDEIVELERLDQQIDKKFIDQHQDLKNRYILASQKFMRYYAKLQDNEDAIKQYNLKALQAIKEAHSTFKLNEKNYKQGLGIDTLVELLGGWESSVLHPSNQIYFQSVYSDIFSKLNPDVKPTFTEKILKTKKREIS